MYMFVRNHYIKYFRWEKRFWEVQIVRDDNLQVLNFPDN